MEHANEAGVRKSDFELATDSTYFNLFPSRIVIQSEMDVVLQSN
jgi:hypothetical protein